MRMACCLATGLLAMGLAVWPARTDNWDTSGSAIGQNDDTPSTHNELIHGSDQLHDLGARPGSVPDQDWYTVTSKPRASYEVVVDATAGDIGTPPLQQYNDAGTILLASGAPVGSGFSTSLRWQNTAATEVSHRVRVLSGFCGSDCTPDDVYRIRFYETTYAAARFNNAATQVTVLIVQNAATYSIGNMFVYFWASDGTLLATHGPVSLLPKAMLNLDTSGVPGLGDAAGSITISHNGRFGDLAGKATALEPATGFSFDTPLTPRPK